MKKLLFVAAPVLAVSALLVACQPTKPAAPAAGSAKINTDLPMSEFMGHVVDPAAFMY